MLPVGSAPGTLLLAGTGVSLDVQAAGREIAEAMGGRGGGSGRTFQGKVPSLAARECGLEARG